MINLKVFQRTTKKLRLDHRKMTLGIAKKNDFIKKLKLIY